MSRPPTRKLRCYTQAEEASNRSTRFKPFLNQPITETLRKQAKIVNPYTQIGDRVKTNSVLNYQRPHSISLISKTGQKAISEVKLAPHIPDLESESQRQQKYRLDKPIFKGSHSLIYRAHLSRTDQAVAIKKIPQDPRSKSRQVAILRRFNHCNILTLIDHYYSLENGRRFLWMVTELFHTDLYHHIRIKRKRINDDVARSYAFQILAGLEQLHGAQIVHRDLKSSNIFVTKQEDRLVIGDLGSARQLSLGETVSGQSCPFSYRAPELLFGPDNYSYSADMWAFGCILIELATFSLPFKARNHTELLLQIMNLLGTPTLNSILEMNPNYDEREYYSLPKIKGKGLREVYQLDHALSDLLKRIFVYSPSRRITAAEALKHEYFRKAEFSNIQSELGKSTDRSLIFTPPSLRTKKEHETMNTLETFEDESPKDIRDQLSMQSSQILVNRNGINIPLKVKRKLQY